MYPCVVFFSFVFFLGTLYVLGQPGRRVMGSLQRAATVRGSGRE